MGGPKERTVIASKKDDVLAAGAHVAAEFGSVDAPVNNAALLKVLRNYVMPKGAMSALTRVLPVSWARYRRTATS